MFKKEESCQQSMYPQSLTQCTDTLGKDLNQIILLPVSDK